MFINILQTQDPQCLEDSRAEGLQEVFLDPSTYLNLIDDNYKHIKFCKYICSGSSVINTNVILLKCPIFWDVLPCSPMFRRNAMPPLLGSRSKVRKETSKQHAGSGSKSV
jgi:hypothetical protein